MTVNSIPVSKDRLSLYPPIEPYHSGFLKVSDIHTLYYEECGNPKGKPVVVLHGGPGGGSSPIYRQYFDPSAYRIILFDQRGCGKSTPTFCLKDNTTQHLIDDIEKSRIHCKVEKFQVFGGSWGSTLSIAYAQQHPDRVTELVLRGIFLLRAKEIDWMYQSGASNCFPDAFDDFVKPIPECERHHMISAYYRRLTDESLDKDYKIQCAQAWSQYELRISRLFVDPDYVKRATESDEFALAFARIESHFFVNGGFLKYDGQLLDESSKLNSIPGVIVQGRYDMVCPAISAYELSKKWTNSKLIIVPDAGHSCQEDGIISELVKATNHYRPK